MSDQPRGLAVVTGASSGIGAEIARQLSAAGHPVLAVARRADRLQGLAEQAAAAGQGVIHPFAADIAAEGAAERLRTRAAELGGAEWLVNAAGVAMFGSTSALEAGKQASMVRLNCEALIGLVNAFTPGLLERRRGVILNVASVAGFQPTPYMSAYGATKAFVLSFSESLSEELRGTGVTVTALCPGPVTTEIFEAGGFTGSRVAPSHEITAEECARAGIAAARKGKALEIPGARNLLQVWSLRLAPRSLVRRISGKVSLQYVGIRKT